MQGKKYLAGPAFPCQYGIHVPVHSWKLLIVSITVYDTCSKTLSDQIEWIQNYAVRIITNDLIQVVNPSDNNLA